MALAILGLAAAVGPAACGPGTVSPKEYCADVCKLSAFCGNTSCHQQFALLSNESVCDALGPDGKPMVTEVSAVLDDCLKWFIENAQCDLGIAGTDLGVFAQSQCRACAATSDSCSPPPCRYDVYCQNQP